MIRFFRSKLQETPRSIKLEINSSLQPAPPNFTGRKKELQKLHNALQANERVVISGLGGIGKTALALEYANSYESDYQWICFISASSENQLISGLITLADNLSISPEVEKTSKRLENLKIWLSQLEYKYLIIFDGVDDEAVIDSLGDHLPNRGKSILLTSRLMKKARPLHFKLVKLEPLTLGEATDYLLNATESREKEAAISLAKTLGCLPLALTHAASYIKDNCSIETYNKDFQEFRLELFDDLLVPLKKEEKTILKTWQLSMNAIEKKLGSSFAKELMNFMSFLAPTSIPIECLELWLTVSNQNRVKLIKAKSMLIDYSMISKSQERDFYQVHKVVQMVTCYQLQDSDKERFLRQDLQVFNKLAEKI